MHTHMHGAGALTANPSRRRRRRRSNPGSTGLTGGGFFANPTYAGLFENPMGPYSMSSIKSFGVAATGLALGLLTARIADRFIATMKPADSKSGNKGNRAWYGKAAAAAINRRPDAIRLGVQAGGAVLAIGGAYALRGRGMAPWALGGVALGFGSNLLLQIAEWWIMPWLLKIKDPAEQTIQNRLFVVEQLDTQDQVAGIFEDWQNTPALAGNQDQNAPVISGPLAPGVVYQLGAAGARPGASSMVGAPRKFVADGRVGHCGECGGNGGHYAGCGQCDLCNGGGGRQCAYTVQAGSDIYAVATAAGITVGDIAALNGGGSPESFWVIGREVVLPEQACNALVRGSIPLTQQTPSTGIPAIPQQPPPPTTSIPVQTYQATGPNVPRSVLSPAAMVAGAPNGASPEATSVGYATAGGE